MLLKANIIIPAGAKTVHYTIMHIAQIYNHRRDSEGMSP